MLWSCFMTKRELLTARERQQWFQLWTGVSQHSEQSRDLALPSSSPLKQHLSGQRVENCDDNLRIWSLRGVSLLRKALMHYLNRCNDHWDTFTVNANYLSYSKYFEKTKRQTEIKLTTGRRTLESALLTQYFNVHSVWGSVHIKAITYFIFSPWNFPTSLAVGNRYGPWRKPKNKNWGGSGNCPTHTNPKIRKMSR